MELRVANVAKEKLVEEGYSELYGARPLKRVIQKRIEDRVSEEILKGTVKEGDRVAVDLMNDRLFFRKEKIKP